MSEHIPLEELPDPTGKIRLEIIIGEGTYGEVFKAYDSVNRKFQFIFSFISARSRWIDFWKKKKKMTGQHVAVKIMESIGDNIEEIEEEYLILRDLCLHPNIPSFYGLYLKRGKRREEDQLWFVMEVSFLKTSIQNIYQSNNQLNRPTAVRCWRHHRFNSRPEKGK